MEKHVLIIKKVRETSFCRIFHPKANDAAQNRKLVFESLKTLFEPSEVIVPLLPGSVGKDDTLVESAFVDLLLSKLYGAIAPATSPIADARVYLVDAPSSTLDVEWSFDGSLDDFDSSSDELA